MRQVPARDFIMTPTAERALAMIRMARDTSSVALFTGPAGLGKTTIIQRFLHEDREARHLTFSSASRNLSSVLKNIADALGIYLDGRSTYELNASIEHWLSHGSYGRREFMSVTPTVTYRGPYVICDEVQNIDLSALRQLLHFNDQYGLPIIAFGNDHTMKRTRANEAAFDQVDDRIRLRDRIERTRGDIAAICDGWQIRDTRARAWVFAYALKTTLRQLFDLLCAARDLSPADDIDVPHLQDALSLKKGPAAANDFLRKFSTQIEAN